MRKKRAKRSFQNTSRNVLLALLVVAAAVAVYGFVNAKIVSHTPAEIQPQGAGSGLDADTLQGLASADILSAAGGGGQLNVYKTDGTTLLGIYLGYTGSVGVGRCAGWAYADPNGGIHVMESGDCYGFGRQTMRL